MRSDDVVDVVSLVDLSKDRMGNNIVYYWSKCSM